MLIWIVCGKHQPWTTISLIVSEDGVQGLLLRGLGTKLITNGVSAMLFSILWKYFEQQLTKPKKA